MASHIDTIEGIVEGPLWFHFDVGNDVLYLRLASHRAARAYGEETPEGFTVFRDDSGTAIGMSVVNFWRRFGRGPIPEQTLGSVQDRVGEWASSHPLAV